MSFGNGQSSFLDNLTRLSPKKYDYNYPLMRKYLLGFAVFFLAFGILCISVLRSASPRYAFSTPSPKPQENSEEKITIEYNMPYPGKILPDSPFWVFKAARDKIWYFLTPNPSKKAELALLYSDKRLSMSKSLFEKEKPDLAYSTLTKAEKYLEIVVAEEKIAREKGMDTGTLLTKISLASLKHRELIEDILKIAPEDARPGIIVIENYAKNVYKSTKEQLNSKGIPAPISPFEGD